MHNEIDRILGIDRKKPVHTVLTQSEIMQRGFHLASKRPFIEAQSILDGVGLADFRDPMAVINEKMNRHRLSDPLEHFRDVGISGPFKPNGLLGSEFARYQEEQRLEDIKKAVSITQYYVRPNDMLSIAIEKNTAAVIEVGATIEKSAKVRFWDEIKKTLAQLLTTKALIVIAILVILAIGATGGLSLSQQKTLAKYQEMLK